MRIGFAASLWCALVCLGCPTQPVVPELPASVPDEPEVSVPVSCIPHEAVLEDGEIPVVKVALVMDISASLQFLDERNLRREAVSDLMVSLSGVRDLRIATFGYGASTWVTPTPGARELFRPAPNWVEPAFFGAADVIGDLEGALATVGQHIDADILATPTVERARSVYRVMVFSDQVPMPRC